MYIILTIAVLAVLVYLLIRANIKNKKQIAEYKKRLEENRRMMQEVSQKLNRLKKIEGEGNERKKEVDNADASGVSDSLNKLFNPSDD